MNAHDLWLRLRALFLRRRVEAELDEELQFHMEMQARKNGESASRKFGNVTAIAEQCRDERGIQLIDNLMRDLRYGWRQLRRAPTFTVIAVLSLALGIGANTALFTVFDSAYLRKVAVPQPDDLISFQWKAFGKTNPLTPQRVYGSRLSMTDNKTGEAYSVGTAFAPKTFELFRTARDIPEEVFGFASISGSVDIDGWPHDVSAQVVSGNYFRALRLTALAGRPLELEDDVPSAPPVAVISQSAWKNLFGASPSTIGRTVVLNGMPTTIVGVVPGEFLHGEGASPAFSVPMTHANRVTQGSLGRPGLWWVQVMARKEPGSTMEQVTDRLQGVFQGEVFASSGVSEPVKPEQFPRLLAFPGNRGFVGISTGSTEDFLLTVAIVFGVLLLIVCLNLANLLIARGSSREYEVSMRLALGASRVRLIRQLLTESLLLSVIGGIAGVLAAFWGKELLKPYLREQIPLAMSWRVLGFNLAIATATGLLFGLMPALRATRSRPVDSTKRRSIGIQPRALLNKTLVVIQIAMSVVLLIGAALLVKSNANWERLDLGFNPKTMIAFDTPPPGASRLGPGTFAAMTERMGSVPGVLAVSTAGCFPPSSCSDNVHSRGAVARSAEVRNLDVPATFFETVGANLIAGRNFTAEDANSSPEAAIIDENAAARLFPGENPLGKRFDFGEGSDRVLEVIGVAKNVVFDVGREEIRPVLYTFETEEKQRGGTSFVIRTNGNTESLIRGIRNAIAEVDPGFPIFGVTTFQQFAEQRLSHQRQLSATWIFFGVAALLLTGIGLYGLMAYTVSRRSNEIGIRIALGASRVNVLGLVMHQIFRLVAIGLVMGIALSLALNQVIRAYMFGVSLFESSVFMAVAVVVASVTTLASYLPARKGTRIDPVISLRSE